MITLKAAFNGLVTGIALVAMIVGYYLLPDIFALMFSK